MKEDTLKTKRMWAVAALAAAAVAAVGASASSARPVAAKAPAAPAAAHKTIKVALVTDIGGLNDKSFNFLANKGLQQAKRQLGSTVAVKESKKNSDYIPNLTSFAAKRYDLVVAVGFLMGESVGKVARKFPNTQFAIIDFSVTDKVINKQKNVTGLLFAEQQAGYLVGTLAGLMQSSTNSRMLDGNVVGSVGGLKIPPVDRYIAGFQAGAKKAKPGTETLNGYSNDFVAQDKCKNLAIQQIAQSADVIFQVAGQCGLGALDAAKEEGHWGIGVDANQSYLGKHMLASAVKRVDQAVFLTAQSMSKGTLKGGKDRVFNLKVNGVGIEGINSAVPASIKAKVAKVATDIKAGKIKIPTTVK